MDGMDRKLKLNPPCQNFDMNAVSQSELEARGIFRVPSTLHDAVGFLEKDKILLEGMGPLGQATGGFLKMAGSLHAWIQKT